MRADLARGADTYRVDISLAARLDRDDLAGVTIADLHLATFGALWQAAALGFAGLREASAHPARSIRIPWPPSAATLT